MIFKVSVRFFDLCVRFPYIYLLITLQVDAHSNLGNLMKAQGLVQEVSVKK